MSMLRSAAALCVLSLSTGCNGFLPLAGADRGEAVAFGDGEAQTFYERDRNGNPVRFGVEFDASFDALDVDGGDVVYDYLLPMPESAPDVLPIRHVSLKWSPVGHAPEHLYAVPHIDAMFFLLSEEERLEITPGECEGAPVSCDTLDRALEPLPVAAQPPGYVTIGHVEPYEGDHLFHLFDSEAGTFDMSFSYGRWDGQIAFLEASATRATLETLEEEDCRAIPTPQAFTRAGWYPTLYCTSWLENGNYRISLEGFTRFTTVDAL